jgi:hypothetical protein
MTLKLDLRSHASRNTARQTRRRSSDAYSLLALATEPLAPPTATSNPAVDDTPASANVQADAVSAKIQKSELAISEPRRHRDKYHLKFSRAWFAGGAPQMPTAFASPNPARRGARSATNSRCHYAEPITAKTTVSEMKSTGGKGGLLIPSLRLGCSGLRRGISSSDQADHSTIR